LGGHNSFEVPMRPYEMGNPELDAAIRALVSAAGEGENRDLVAELITTALKLYRDQPDRGEIKLFNTAMKEMRYSSLVFSQYRNRMKVTVFGSARTQEQDSDYRLVHDFARHMAIERGWMVITGAGPGIMEAGNRGAGMEASFGVNIRLPFEASANEYIPDQRVINFKYFFTRKLGFVKEAHAFVIAPGGFGTMDEAFELLTLIQTGKTDIHPIVLLETDGGTYWQTWRTFVEGELLGSGMISPDDLNLYMITSDVEAAADEICGFYRNYHSQRYVEGRLVLRMNVAPDPEELERMNDAFTDIVTKGAIEVIEATPAEVADDDALECARVSLWFDRRHFGRLRALIDQINKLDGMGKTTSQLPTAFNPDGGSDPE
jgi:uncharacterized protein (TIGR00730 family)